MEDVLVFSPHTQTDKVKLFMKLSKVILFTYHISKQEISQSALQMQVKALEH